MRSTRSSALDSWSQAAGSGRCVPQHDDISLPGNVIQLSSSSVADRPVLLPTRRTDRIAREKGQGAQSAGARQGFTAHEDLAGTVYPRVWTPPRLQGV